MNLAIIKRSYQIINKFFSIKYNFFNTLRYPLWIGNLYPVGISPEFPDNLKLIPVSRYTGIYSQAVKVWPDSQYPLGNSHIIPGSCSGKPGIFSFSMIGGILAGNHL